MVFEWEPYTLFYEGAHWLAAGGLQADGVPEPNDREVIMQYPLLRSYPLADFIKQVYK